MTHAVETIQLILAKISLTQTNQRQGQLEGFIATTRFSEMDKLAQASYRNLAMLHADLARETERLIQRIEGGVK